MFVEHLLARVSLSNGASLLACKHRQWYNKVDPTETTCTRGRYRRTMDDTDNGSHNIVVGEGVAAEVAR